jgi:hypothetical protein
MVLETDCVPGKCLEPETVRCSSCNRELKSPCEWIEGNHRILCDMCYSNLLWSNLRNAIEDNFD